MAAPLAWLNTTTEIRNSVTQYCVGCGAKSLSIINWCLFALHVWVQARAWFTIHDLLSTSLHSNRYEPSPSIIRAVNISEYTCRKLSVKYDIFKIHDKTVSYLGKLKNFLKKKFNVWPDFRIRYLNLISYRMDAALVWIWQFIHMYYELEGWS